MVNNDNVDFNTIDTVKVNSSASHLLDNNDKKSRYGFNSLC